MEIRYSRGGLLGWVQERWFEFRMGHGTYLGFILSFTNFVLIVYSLFLEKIFSDLTLLQFCLIFGCLYVPTSIIIGKLHIRKQIKIRHRHGLQREPRVPGHDEGVQGTAEEACHRGRHTIKVVLTTHICAKRVHPSHKH